MQNIGFIGIGVMGSSMVQNLLKQGFNVSVYTRTKAKAEDAIKAGAIWCDSISQCVGKNDAIITMVGFPSDVADVYFSDNGIINSAKSGAYLIDMTTTSPKLSKEIAIRAAEKGLFALDAPVSGGDVGAKNATLSIMVGGEKSAFEKCMLIFSAMGTTIVYEGKAGNGQHTKMANQIAIAGAVAGACEAIAYSKAAGLDLSIMLDSISKGAAGSWQLSNNAPKMLLEDFAPGFYIKHYIKDMNIASQEAEARETELPILETVLKMYNNLENMGMGELGTQALIKNYEKL